MYIHIYIHIYYAHLASVGFEHFVCRGSLMTTCNILHICTYNIYIYIILHFIYIIYRHIYNNKLYLNTQVTYIKDLGYQRYLRHNYLAQVEYT